MTQTDRSPDQRKEVRPGLTENYTPVANVLLQGFPALSISERYVAIGLVALYWDEKIYPVSLRELATKIQIDHTMLRSRDGKRPSEGILDKLWRLGIIGLMEGKPTTELGNKGRIQTYLTVHHRFIAEQNAHYTLSKKVRNPRSITVGNTNGSTNKTDVGNTNDTVGHDNHTVVHVSTNMPPKKEKNKKESLKTNRKREEEERDVSSTPPNNPSLSLSEKTEPTSEAIQLKEAWCSRFPGGTAFGPKSWEHAEKLAAPLLAIAQQQSISLVEVFTKIEEYARAKEKARNKTFYQTNGFCFWHIPGELEGWQSTLLSIQKPSEKPSEEPAPEPDPTTPILWTRTKHPGRAIDHWWLYEMMPRVEAMQYGWKPNSIPPNDRTDIKSSLKALATGDCTLTREQQAEKDQKVLVA